MNNKKTPSQSDIQNDGITQKAPLTRGERLKKELKRAGFTHAEFAECIGYATKSISNYCTGNRWIPDENIPRIAEIINERLRKQGDYVFPEYLAGMVDYRNENERIKQSELEIENDINSIKQKRELAKAFLLLLNASGYSIRSFAVPDWAGMLKAMRNHYNEKQINPLNNAFRYSSMHEWISGEKLDSISIGMAIDEMRLYYPAGIVYYLKTPTGELKTLTHAELLHMYESAKSVLGALFTGIIDRPGNSCVLTNQDAIQLADLSFTDLSFILGLSGLTVFTDMLE